MGEEERKVGDREMIRKKWMGQMKKADKMKPKKEKVKGAHKVITIITQ